MATVTTSQTYVLTNGYLLSDYVLAVNSNGDLFMNQAEDTGDTDHWVLTETDTSPFYRIHNVALTEDFSLDVINDAGTESNSLHMAETGLYTGQFWRLDAWMDGYRLSNNFTGPGRYLDTYSDTRDLHLSDGDHSGQAWAFDAVGGSGSDDDPGEDGEDGEDDRVDVKSDDGPGSSSSSSSSSTTSTSDVSSNVVEPSTTSQQVTTTSASQLVIGDGDGDGESTSTIHHSSAASSDPASDPSSAPTDPPPAQPASSTPSNDLSAGAIAGIVIGGIGALALVLAAVAYFMMVARRQRRDNNAAGVVAATDALGGGGGGGGGVGGVGSPEADSRPVHKSPSPVVMRQSVVTPPPPWSEGWSTRVDGAVEAPNNGVRTTTAYELPPQGYSHSPYELPARH